MGTRQRRSFDWTTGAPASLGPKTASPASSASFAPAPRAGARRALRLLSLLAASALVAACAASRGPGDGHSFLPPELPSGFTAKKLAHADLDMVAAAHPLAVEVGVAMLARGGSAVDAAIATQMVLNLVEPQSSGIGGGGFMLHYDGATRAIESYDGRETAPAQASADLFVARDGRPMPFRAAVDGGLAVGTPGLLRMLEAAHRAHGRLPWAALFDPAIALADRGFEISPRLATQIAGAAARMRAQGAPVADYFLTAQGAPKTAGTLLRNPEFAQTLRLIAAGGVEAFYQGEIARAIVEKVRTHPAQPGRLTLDDLAAYRAKSRDPVCAPYRVFRVCAMGPPSSGGVTVLQTLGLLEHFDLAAFAPDSVDAVHLVSEAYRLAYADRARYLADADFVAVPVAGLLDARYLRERARAIRMDRTIGVPAAGTPAGAQARGDDASAALPATTHLSIVDRDGNAVSMTTSIEQGFGSLQMVRGFLLNNQLTDFSFAASDAAGRPIANRVEPGKRPRSSMAPAIVLGRDGVLEAIVGSPGGSNIIQYVTKSLVGLIDWRLNAQQASDLSNFGAQTSASTALEKGMPAQSAADGLRARGHTVSIVDINSGVHIVVFNGKRADGTPGALSRDARAGKWAGGADPRREGTALGNGAR